MKVLVPKLRFKEFTGEWLETTINSIATINPKNSTLPDKFIYIDLESVENGILRKENLISKEEAPSRAQRQVKQNDILFQTVRPYQQNNLFINKINDIPYIASTGYALLRTNKNPYFLFALLHQKSFLDNVLSMCTGTSFPAISSSDLGTILIRLPKIEEQKKIANLILLLDKKIELQSKKIEALKLYNKGLFQHLFSSEVNYKNILLGDICCITTGKLDANAMDQNGIYRFYTCASNYCYINEYAFDTEALLISGNGANVGYIHYYKGKFNAYQRTYVLYNFKENIQYIKCFLDKYLRKRISLEKKEGNTPYIVISTLSNMNIMIPVLSKQIMIVNISLSIEKKLLFESKYLKKLNNLKKGLMQNMFV